MNRKRRKKRMLKMIMIAKRVYKKRIKRMKILSKKKNQGKKRLKS